MHKTVTGHNHRGNGLPGIYDSYKNNYLSNMIVVSNNVFVDIEGNIYRNVKENFSGTFFYWELTKSNLTFDIKQDKSVS